VPVPFDRKSKRASMAVSIAADGWLMKPLRVVHRATVERELIYDGYERSKVLIFRQRCASMTRALFLQWVNQEFFPAVRRRRREFDDKGPAL
jgi:hypothetical protein